MASTKKDILNRPFFPSQSLQPNIAPWKLKLRNYACKATLGFFASASITSVLSMLFITFIARTSQPDIVFVFLLVSFVGFLLSLTVWLVILAVFFTQWRFSLRTLVLLVFGAGLCVSLIVGPLSDGWKGLGGFGLFGLFCGGLFWFASYDPDKSAPLLPNRKSDEGSQPVGGPMKNDDSKQSE